QYINKENYTWAKVTIINSLTGIKNKNLEAGFTAYAGIKYRGHSSYSTFDKKQYRIEFRQGYGEQAAKNYPVMGMAPASDWVLNNPFLDRSLIRNRLLYSVSRELNVWSPDTRFCEVFLDGEYQGVYLMVEPVTNDEGRLNLARFGLISGQTAYIVRRERPGTEDNPISTYGSQNGYTSHELSIGFPTRRFLTERQRRWIENDISRFERVLYSDQFDDPESGYAAYIDVDSFVDYYIINELSINNDAGELSTYVYKDLGGKLRKAVWDFNNAFGNTQWEPANFEKFYVAESNWYDRLFRDKAFTDAVISRYRELRRGVLSEENLLRLVYENVEYLGEAIDRNFAIWGYTFNCELQLFVDPQEIIRDPSNYKEAVQQLKDAIVERGNFLDQNIEKLYQYAIN
ncbi:MAG: spore coat protein CotH, partial [Deltaproteobacteria bacterium]|nr:spore coat protein CotH [Deltaproteobacteria bacterium]